MKVHYVYNKKTGEIVHLHLSDDGLDISKAGILHKVDSSINRNQLDVFTTDKLLQGESLQIDVNKKEVKKNTSKNKSQVGFGFHEQGSDDGQPARTSKKTIYKKAE